MHTIFSVHVRIICTSSPSYLLFLNADAGKHL